MSRDDDTFKVYVLRRRDRNEWKARLAQGDQTARQVIFGASKFPIDRARSRVRHDALGAELARVGKHSRGLAKI